MNTHIRRIAYTLMLGLLLAVGAEAQVEPSSAAGRTDAFATCRNTVRSEPIVSWDVTGHNFAGMLIHGTLVVYNNGVASVSSLRSGDVRSTTVDLRLARALLDGLIEEGATVLCDGPFATDMPLTTVTVLGGAPDARAHTFSYWEPTDSYALIQERLDAFVATHFQGFSLY